MFVWPTLEPSKPIISSPNLLLSDSKRLVQCGATPPLCTINVKRIFSFFFLLPSSPPCRRNSEIPFCCCKYTKSIKNGDPE